MKQIALFCLLLLSSVVFASGDGLLGNYYDQSGGAFDPQTAPFKGMLVQRVDSQVNFNWGTGSPISGIGVDNFTVRWTGEIEFPQNGAYKFSTASDDGVRVYIDLNRNGNFTDVNETIINNWADHALTTDTSGPVNISNSAVRYPIRMEFYERGGSAQAELYWNPPGGGSAYVLIPQANLYSLTPPTISSVSVPCASNSIDVVFSKTVDSVTATTPTNYAVSGGVTVSAVSLLNSTSVRLTTNVLNSGANYTVTVNNVQDMAGQTIASNSTGSTTATVGSYQAGILGAYFDQNGVQRAYFTGNSYNRVDPAINFDWGGGAPIIPVGVDDFSVQWNGYVKPTTTGSYTFYISGDDGIRLYLDGSLIANYWSDHADSEVASTTVTLNAGQYYRVTYEMYERSGNAIARLFWQGPSIAKQMVPSANLFHCATGVTPIALYQMDESGWNGSAGEVTNAVSSSFAGRAVGINTNTGMVCRGANFPNTLTPPAYVSLPVSNPAGSSVAYSDFSFGGWVQFAANADYTVLAGTRGSGATLAHGLWLRRTSSTGWSVYLPDVQAAVVGLTLPATSSSTWYYVGMVRRLASVSLYLYDATGALLGSAAGALAGSGSFTVDELRLGFDAYAAANAGLGSDGRQFYGVMDEVRFYNSALTSTQLSLAAQATHACPSYGPSSFGISVGAGAASTCQPRAITITALTSGGAALTTYTGTVSISTSSGHGNWTKATAVGTLTQAVSDSGAASYVFVAGDNGSAILNLADTHADDLTISVNDSTYGITSTSAALQFRDNAFVLTPTTPSALASPDVIAGRAQNFKVEMWTMGAGVCSVATAYSGSKTLKAWAAVDAASPVQPVSATLPSVNAVAMGNAAPATNNLPLTFTNGVASISVLGTDVGKLAVSLLDDSRSYANAVAISGGSGIFVIRPFGFYIGGVSTATGPAGSVFRAAGVAFPLAVTAVQYDASDDDGTGNPSTSADLSNNAVVPHFGNESPSHSVSVSSGLALPIGGNAGVLTVNNYASFSAGMQSQPASYSEVGIINLTAALVGGNYLGSGRNISGYQLNVGRFRPDHFRVSNGVITAGCSTFTYMGQNFTAGARITAENAANATTLNYTGGFALLNLATSAVGFTAADLVTPTPLSSRLTVSAFSGSWLNGVTTISDTLVLNRAAATDGPYTNFAVGLAPTDLDGVMAIGLNLDSDNNSSVDSVQLATSVQRYGRIAMENSTASELIPLAIPIGVEYWNSANNSFVTSTTDTCSSGQLSLIPAGPPQWGNFLLSGYQNNLSVGETTPTSFTGLVNGIGLLTLSAPGTGNEGAVTVTVQVPTWLKFDFDSSIAGDEFPSARASFGLFKGRDPLIYWREYYR